MKKFYIFLSESKYGAFLFSLGGIGLMFLWVWFMTEDDMPDLSEQRKKFFNWLTEKIAPGMEKGDMQWLDNYFAEKEQVNQKEFQYYSWDEIRQMNEAKWEKNMEIKRNQWEVWKRMYEEDSERLKAKKALEEAKKKMERKFRLYD